MKKYFETIIFLATLLVLIAQPFISAYVVNRQLTTTLSAFNITVE